MTARLTKAICTGAGQSVVLTAEQAQFRTLTCPVCNRRNLGAESVRHQHVDRSDIDFFVLAPVGTVPTHRAKAATAKDVRLGGARFVMHDEGEWRMGYG